MDRVGDWRLLSLLEENGEEEIYAATDEAKEDLRVRILTAVAPEEDKIAFEEMERIEEGTSFGLHHIREVGRTPEGRPYAVYTTA